jgi:phosphoribulokinase
VARVVILGVVGDSGAGKTTLTRGLLRVLGDEDVARLSTDDYHRFDRRRRAELGVTPLDPAANHLDILTQHVLHLRRGEPVLKPVYDHRDGTLRAPEYLRPAGFLLVEGLLGFHSETLRTAQHVKVFLAPSEELRRGWKLKRDCTHRGYNTDEVLRELDNREADAERWLRPQCEHADIVVSFREDLHAEVLLRNTLEHPDFSNVLETVRGEEGVLLRIPGDIHPEQAAELEEAVWGCMTFASHLRVRRLGEYTAGTDLRRSPSLALVQVILLFHLVHARAELTTGAPVPRVPRPRPTGADSALHV